jgi:excinuclease ABC subunit C
MQLADFQKIDLPDLPGVYFFHGPSPKKEILYIGRATSLKDRVRSYFSNDLISTRGPLLVDMVTSAETIEFTVTDSVLEAVILEANQIKKYQPRYNTKEKDDKSFYYVLITEEDFPLVTLIRGKDLDEHYPKDKIKYVFGPYPNGGVLREGLKIIRKIFPFRTEKCKPGQGKPCFDRQIGLCPGCCTNEISIKDYSRNIQHIRFFFEGKKQKILDGLNRDMMNFAKYEQFEEANQIKRVAFALTHIQDLSILKAEHDSQTSTNDAITQEKALFRIESYDIAHTGGKNAIGVMTVSEGNELKKADYRQFKIKIAKGGDDPAALSEVLRRRLAHPEWTYPNLIVIDGGDIQKNAAEAVLKELQFDIAVVSVKKDERHVAEEILGDKEIIAERKKLILLLNSESHRFALKHHRKSRSSDFLPK